MAFDMDLVPSYARIKQQYIQDNGDLGKSLGKEKWYTTLMINFAAMKVIGLTT